MGIMILQAVAASFVFVDVLQVAKRIRFLDRKPFTCNVCMAGWLFIPLFFSHAHWIELPYDIALAMTAFYIVNQLIGKL